MSNQTLYGRLLSRFCNDSKNIDSYVHNLTSTYADSSKEPPMVAASVIMFLLAGLFFNLNLFSRFSDVSAILNPKVRVFLSPALSLFLPVMSYLFSEAKNTATAGGAVGQKPDLSLRAGVILAWMLLVELIRKKVDEIHMRGYSSTVQRAGRVAWLGSLVFFNIRSAGRKAFFAILWVLCATKVLQRIAFTEVGKRSYTYGKNARLIASYMSQTLAAGPGRDDIDETRVDVDVEHSGAAVDHLLRSSKLIVTGEEDIVVEPTVDGYELKKENSTPPTFVTVGRIWKDVGAADLIDPDQRLKRLCLSFALFKLLRRRFEHQREAPAETRECRDLIFDGVYKKKEDMAGTVFQMMNTEVNFLSEYYHSVVPVVFASPFFFLANYVLLPVVVLALCLTTVVLCGNGDARYAIGSIKTDNFAIQSGVVSTTVCLFMKATREPTAFFAALDFSVTFLLFVIFFYEEIWEFIVFLLSDWFMVSLLCNYVAKPELRRSPMYRATVRRILWVRSKMSHPTLSFKQLSVMDLRWPLVLGMPSMLSLLLRTAPVPNKAKHSIMECLVEHSRDGAPPLSNGKSVLAGWQEQDDGQLLRDMLPACRSDSVAEVILTWHVATTLLEEACPPPDTKSSHSHRVAARLSQYGAYLVAFHPELLPDNQDKTERVFEAMKEELKSKLTCCGYFFMRWRTRVSMVMNRDTTDWADKDVVHNGAKLGKLLRDEASRDGGRRLERTWKLLADVWTELIVYVAPSSDEDRLMGHEKVLVEGGEFITVLWALTTHTGVTRPAQKP